MDVDALREAARTALPDDVWGYYQGTADDGPDSERDARAWAQIDLVPRVLTGLTSIDTSVRLGSLQLPTPIMISATASHGGCVEDGELSTIAGAGAAGALMAYSFNATIPVARFGAAATSPWWAQIYLQRDRSRTADYVAACTAAGASGLVLTIDVPGTLADAPFRRLPFTGPVAVRGNTRPTGGGAGDLVESALTADVLADMVASTDLPVWAKGVMAAADVPAILSTGVAGIIVSNHGRRQLAGVAPVATVLGEVVRAVDGRVPVLVDGGIRSGVDAVRALALGAAAVGVGRPVLWALATGGSEGVRSLLTTLTDEVSVALAGLGVGRISDLDSSMLRMPNR